MDFTKREIVVLKSVLSAAHAEGIQDRETKKVVEILWTEFSQALHRKRYIPERSESYAKKRIALKGEDSDLNNLF